MRRRNLYFIVLTSLLSVSCSSPYAVLERYKGMSIAVGNAGGITGMTQGVSFNTDCTVWRFSGRLGSRDSVGLFIAPKDSIRSFYDRLDAMKFSELQYDSIGNVTNFVELRTSKLIHRVRWTDSDTSAPAALRRLASDILNFVETSSAKTKAVE